MHMNELRRMLDAGKRPVVEFLPDCKKDECIAESCLDPGMRARINSIRLKHDDILEVEFDQGQFEAFNEPFALADYRDDRGLNTLTAKQAGRWCRVETIYMDLEADLSSKLKLVTDEHTAGAQALFAQYRQSGYAGNYVSWLEAKVLEHASHSS